MNRVKGLRRDEAERLAATVRERGRFTSLQALWQASGVSARALRLLAHADAFGSMGLDRQSALWHARKLRDQEAPLFDALNAKVIEKPVKLPQLPGLRHVVQDYHTVGLSLRDHPIRFLRPWLDARRAITAADLVDERRFPRGRGASVAGLCLVRQRPSTAHGITFMTIEDETGAANLIIRPHIYERFRPVVRHATALLARGRIDRNGEVVHLVVSSVLALDDRLEQLRAMSRDFH